MQSCRGSYFPVKPTPVFAKYVGYEGKGLSSGAAGQLLIETLHRKKLQV